MAAPARRPRARARAGAGGRRGRPGPRAGRAARAQQDHDAARDHRRVGHPAAVRRGQRRPDPGQARRPPQPGAGAARGLQRRELRARAAASRRCARAGSSTSRSSTARRRTPSTRCSPPWPSGRSTVPRVGHDRGQADVPGDRLDEPVRQRRHGPAVHQRLTTGCAGCRSATRTTAAERGIVAAAHRACRVPRDAAGRRRGRGHPGDPGAPRRAPGQQRARRDRPDPGRRPSCAELRAAVAGRGRRALPRTLVLDAMLGRAVRPDPPRRDGRDRRPSRCCGRSGRTTSSCCRAAAEPG